MDLDGDGDLDIVAGLARKSRIFWFENLGGKEIFFQQHSISIASAGNAPQQEPKVTGFNLGFYDFNGDGRLDVALAASNSLAWLEQPADPAESWIHHVIGTLDPDELVGFAIAGINGDGRVMS